MINFLSGINSTSSALEAERIRMEIVAQNIAHANTTHDVDGKPYQRQQVVFESLLKKEQQASALGGASSTVHISRIERDQRPARLVYNPGSPEANANGMVEVPNVNIHEEMADLIASSRAYEANLAVVKNARALALQTLAIGKR